ARIAAARTRAVRRANLCAKCVCPVGKGLHAKVVIAAHPQTGEGQSRTAEDDRRLPARSGLLEGHGGWRRRLARYHCGVRLRRLETQLEGHCMSRFGLHETLHVALVFAAPYFAPAGLEVHDALEGRHAHELSVD